MKSASGIFLLLVLLNLTTGNSARHSANQPPLLDLNRADELTSRKLQQQQQQPSIAGAPLLLPVAAVPSKPGCFWYKAVSQSREAEELAIDVSLEPVMVCPNPAGTVRKAGTAPAIRATQSAAEPDLPGAATNATSRHAQPAAALQQTTALEPSAAAEPQQATANATAPVAQTTQVPLVVLPGPAFVQTAAAPSPEPPQAPPCASCRRVVTPVCANNTTWDNACQAACRGLFTFTDGRCGGKWRVQCECPEVAEPVCAAGVIDFKNGCLAECHGFLGYKPGACSPPAPTGP